VLEGQMTLVMDDQEIVLNAGDVLFRGVRITRGAIVRPSEFACCTSLSMEHSTPK
jgi:hypothetical protein